MSKQQSKPVDPVIIVTLGVVFLAIAFALIAFKPTSQSINADSSAWRQLVVAFVTGLTTGGLS